MNFMFEWQKRYLTSERSERVRCRFCHENIKFISLSQRVMFFLLYGDQMKFILGNPGLQRGREGRERLEAGKKERGGEGKGKGKGEALGSFSIQIISRSITFLSRYWPHF